MPSHSKFCQGLSSQFWSSAALLILTSLPSGFVHQSPRTASLWKRSSFQGLHLGTRFCPLGRGPRLWFPHNLALGAPAGRLTFPGFLLPSASVLLSVVPPPHHRTVGPSFFPGRTRLPLGESPRGLLARHPRDFPQPPPVSVSPWALSSPPQPPPSRPRPSSLFSSSLPPSPASTLPPAPLPQLTGPRRSASVATELLLGLPRVRPAHYPITASRGCRRAAAQTPGKCCSRVRGLGRRPLLENYRLSQGLT